MTKRQIERQVQLQRAMARETQGGASVREHRALQLMPAAASFSSPPRRMVVCFSSEGHTIRSQSEGEVLRKERLGKMTVKRREGVIISARECRLPRRQFDERMMGLWRVKYTSIDYDGDGRSLRHRVRFK